MVASRALTDREALPYLVVTLAGYEALLMTTSSQNHWDQLGVILGVIITIAGIVFAYQKNGGSNGQDFSNRYFALGWVFSVRFVLMVCLPLLVIFGITLEYLMPSDSNETQWWEVIFYTVLQVVFYLRLGRHFRDVAGNSAPTEDRTEVSN